jgi:hypothetical protein
MSFYVTNCWEGGRGEGGREGGRGKLSFQCLRPFGPQTKIMETITKFKKKLTFRDPRPAASNCQVFSSIDIPKSSTIPADLH